MLFTDDVMFPNDLDSCKHSLILMAGFHIGIPFSIYDSRAHNGWQAIKDNISQRISREPPSFRMVPMAYHPETIFPLGKPVSIRYQEFFEVFDLAAYFQEQGISLLSSDYRLDHLIWVCPAGVILVMAQISFTAEKTASLVQLEEIVENHYAELTFIFSQVAALIFSDISTEQLSPLLCSEEDIARCKQVIAYNDKLVPLDSSSRREALRHVGVSVHADPEILSLYESILVDVYFIAYTESAGPASIDIGYTDSSIRFPDRSHLPLLGIGFSIFVELLWIQKKLRQNLLSLQRGIVGMSQPKDESAAQLRLFRMFTRLFLAESSPINVRLKAEYMTRLEEFWKAERMDALIEQINDQLDTLQTMFDWVQERKNAALTFRFTIAGILFTVLSVTSVVGSLISTFDPRNDTISTEWRVVFVVGSLLISIVLLASVLRARPTPLINRSNHR